ncbi:hypothetical protein F4X10_19035 [Candidatus Poribacteria bacterium]|nr:hypothetical protein [Candidatus Poribacteria bacterium]
MKNLSFKTLIMVSILAVAGLVVNPVTPESTADSYYLYVKLTPARCWDNSGSIDVLCYSYTEIDWWTDPPNHGNEHSPNGYYTLAGYPKDYYTDSCYTGCD